MAARRPQLRIYLERGDKRTFAVAVDWPGWSRSGRADEEALRALLAYAPRYAAVVKRAGLKEGLPGADAKVQIVQRLSGGGGTDFGVPSVATKQDAEPLRGKELARQRALLEASWKAFDAAARSARGRTLRLGPRGGGRNLAKMTGHVLEAEVAYLGALGSKPPVGAAKNEMAAVRKAALATLDAVANGRPIENPRNTLHPWSARYFVRRSAWHALDHAWEIEDRSEA
ncbi:MAG TPA: DinB family protein [Candidatus Limnocylindria bacterium]|nr:DinB family protein [Candidatus Limnocylindria bacterium]